VRGGWIPDPVLPDRLRGTRWTLTPRHVAVISLVLLIGLLWAGCSVLRSRPHQVPDQQPPTTLTTGSPVAAPSTQASPGSSPTSTPPAIIVHVAGKVRKPGLIRTHAGARVADALTAAGGPLPGTDLTTLNLARPLTDGEQILVGVPATTQSNALPPGTTQPGAPTSPTQVDLNTATLAQLETLPGVGPVLAQRILDYRTQNGPFTTIDQLQEVPGVGQKKFDSLKPHVRI
jgi:competence protein ComEA